MALCRARVRDPGQPPGPIGHREAWIRGRDRWSDPAYAWPSRGCILRPAGRGEPRCPAAVRSARADHAPVHAGAPSASGRVKSTQSMTWPSQQTRAGSPRAADDHGIQVTSHSGHVIRLPIPAAPRFPQFQHCLGSTCWWPPLMALPLLTLIPHVTRIRAAPLAAAPGTDPPARRRYRRHGARPLHDDRVHGAPLTPYLKGGANSKR